MSAYILQKEKMYILYLFMSEIDSDNRKWKLKISFLLNDK